MSTINLKDTEWALQSMAESTMLSEKHRLAIQHALALVSQTRVAFDLTGSHNAADLRHLAGHTPETAIQANLV